MDATTDPPDMGRTTIQVSDELADELHSRKSRGESYEDVIWNLIEQGDEGESGESASTEASATEVQHDAREAPESAPEQTESIGRLESFPQTQDVDDCLRAVHAARDFLKEEGPASMREIVNNVMPEHPLGYDIPELETGERYRGTWWRKIVQPGLKELDDVEYRENHADYRYTAGSDE